jgi:hypothetical protein
VGIRGKQDNDVRGHLVHGARASQGKLERDAIETHPVQQFPFQLLLPPSSSATSFSSPRINASNADATAEKESDTMIGDDAEDEDAFLREAMEIRQADEL